MKHASTRELFDYWDRLRGGATAARRSAIEPADIRHILCDTFILEGGERDSFPFRLAGTRLCAGFGRELKATRFVDLWTPADRGQIAVALSDVRDEGRVAVVSVTGQASEGRAVGFELILLPLVQDGPRYDRILGLLVPMELPVWLGLSPLTTLLTTGCRLLRPAGGEQLATRVGLAPEIMIRPALAAERRRGRFVVLDGGRAGR